MLLIFAGAGTMFDTLTMMVALAVEGEFTEFFGRRRMISRVESSRGHRIICGFGRVGREIAREFHERGLPFVVIDNNPAVAPPRELGSLSINGNATEDEGLRQARVVHAAALPAAADADTDNTFIMLSARARNPDIDIAARARQTIVSDKLMRAGANREISPYNTAGLHMAVPAIQPAMAGFMVTGSASRDDDRILAESTVIPASGLDGQTLGAVFGRRRGTAVLGLCREGGDVVAGPHSEEVPRDQDRVIALGPPGEIARLAQSGSDSVRAPATAFPSTPGASRFRRIIRGTSAPGH